MNIVYDAWEANASQREIELAWVVGIGRWVI
jgi:hypothetical protein